MKKLLLLGFIVAAVPHLVKAADESGFRSLRERCSIASHEGVVAYPAGTEVLVLSEKNGTCSVKVGERTFEVELSKLTPRPAAVQTSASSQETTFSPDQTEQTEQTDESAASLESPGSTASVHRSASKGSTGQTQKSASTGITYGSIVILPKRPIVLRPYPFYPYLSPSYKIRTVPSAYDWHNWSSLSAIEMTADPEVSNLQPTEPSAPQQPAVTPVVKEASSGNLELRKKLPTR